jgi:outer membrane protein TolC
MKRTLITGLVVLAIVPAYAQRQLTLEECRQLALRNSRAVKNSVLEREAAAQTRKAAFTKFFPSVSASGAAFAANKNMMEIATQGGDLPVYNGDPATLRAATQYAYMPASTMGLMESGMFGVVTATQPIFAGGRICNGNRLASLGEDVGELRERIVRNEAMLKTEEEYWRLISLREKARTLGEYRAMLDALYATVSDAYKNGLAGRNDMLKVQVKRSEILLNVSKLDGARDLALRSFCQHIGIPFDSSIVLIDTLRIDGAPAAFRVDHPAALQKRPETQLLAAGTRAEELQSSMKLGEYLPQAAVGVNGLYMKVDKDKGRSIGMVFGTVSVPISGWWEASHTLEERSLREQIAVNAQRDNTELLILQMDKAYRDLSDAFEQVRVTNDARDQAGENLKVTQDAYGNGMIGLSDLLEAQAMRQNMQDQYVDAMAAYRKALVTYLQVTGR